MGVFILKNILIITMTIIGSIIGAGFASGQEINSFFYKYGIIGILGILISIFLISLIIYKVFLIIKKENINNYKEFLKIIFENKTIKKNKIINKKNNLKINNKKSNKLNKKKYLNIYFYLIFYYLFLNYFLFYFYR